MPRLVIALDTLDIDTAKDIVESVDELCMYYKIHILFLKEWQKIIEYLKSKKKQVILDLKFFDIPTVMQRYIEILAEMGVDFFTFHLLSGEKGIKAVVEKVRELEAKNPTAPKPIGVTILTSYSNEEKIKFFPSHPNKDPVELLVEEGVKLGIENFVLSIEEAEKIKTLYPNVKLFVPGVRITDEKGDQQRVLDLKNGFSLNHLKSVDYIIMGRDIISAKNYRERVRYILSKFIPT